GRLLGDRGRLGDHGLALHVQLGGHRRLHRRPDGSAPARCGGRGDDQQFGATAGRIAGGPLHRARRLCRPRPAPHYECAVNHDSPPTGLRVGRAPRPRPTLVYLPTLPVWSIPGQGRTTMTGHLASRSTLALVDPSSSEAKPPRPREPTPTSCAPADRSITEAAGRSATTARSTGRSG